MSQPTKWPEGSHSTSSFQNALDVLDERLGSCDGQLAVLTHCRNTMSPERCKEDGAAFYACNKAKIARHAAMADRCKEPGAAFDACMLTHSREPERCLVVLEALHACCEAKGVFN